jgi:elongation factor Ts
MLRCLQSRLFSTLKIPIEAIKKLREETSAPIGQCKTALEETNGDHKAALAWLKKKGLGQADKRVDKETREGVIGAMVT